MWVGGSTLGAVAVHHVGLQDATTHCCSVQFSLFVEMASSEGSGSSQDVPATIGASQLQVVRVKELNEIIQSLIQKVLADEGGQQGATSDSGERPVGVLGSRSSSVMG